MGAASEVPVLVGGCGINRGRLAGGGGTARDPASPGTFHPSWAPSGTTFCRQPRVYEDHHLGAMVRAILHGLRVAAKTSVYLSADQLWSKLLLPFYQPTLILDYWHFDHLDSSATSVR